MDTRVLAPIVQRVYDSIRDVVEQESFTPLLEGFAEAFAMAGVPVDRLQIPMTKFNGFRHPMLAAIILTWRRGQDVSAIFVPHYESEPTDSLDMGTLEKRVANTPYHNLLFADQLSIRRDLRRVVEPFPIFQELRQEGFIDYYASVLDMPSGSRQIVSLCSGGDGGLGDTVDDCFRALEPVLAMALHSAYLSSVCRQLADTYIGQLTGRRVLDGEIRRGSRDRLQAGIMFCDVRGFTAMSETMAGDELVGLMNTLFECIGEKVEEQGGEILKFIGDAMLIVYPADHYETDTALGRALITTAISASAAVQTLGEEVGRPLAVGFGAHIGEVLYGNIGTSKRLDFTVMGPAVNLTSRLESLCKPLGARLAVSAEVAAGNEDLVTDLGEHRLKGVSRARRVFGLGC